MILTSGTKSTNLALFENSVDVSHLLTIYLSSHLKRYSSKTTFLLPNQNSKTILCIHLPVTMTTKSIAILEICLVKANFLLLCTLVQKRFLRMLTKPISLIGFSIQSVFNDHSTLPFYESSTIPADSLSSISISIHDIWDALVTLDTTKAMGCDGIPLLILKHAATALVDPIHHLFNLCISQSSLPSEWCSHLITPIPKSGDRSNIENYRPISLLCSISKVLEKIIFDKVSDFILNHTISLSQFGFIKKWSTI